MQGEPLGDGGVSVVTHAPSVGTLVMAIAVRGWGPMGSLCTCASISL